MPAVKRTLYVGLGEFGSQVIGRWLDYVRFRLPDALPFLDSIGLCRPGAAVREPWAPRRRFGQGGSPVVTFERWVFGIDLPGVAPPAAAPSNPLGGRLAYPVLPADDSLVRLVKRRYDALTAAIGPPPGWPFGDAGQASPRLVIVGHVHDRLTEQWLLGDVDLSENAQPGLENVPRSGGPRSGFSGLWRRIIAPQGLGRDVWLVLFIDPAPSTSSWAATREMVRRLETACRGLVGEDRTGLEVLLVSARSRPPAGPAVAEIALWDGVPEQGNAQYWINASEYGLMILQTLLASDDGAGGQRLHLDLRTQGPAPDTVFSTTCLWKLDAPVGECRRYAAAQRLAQDIGTLLGPDPPALPQPDEDVGTWIEERVNVAVELPRGPVQDDGDMEEDARLRDIDSLKDGYAVAVVEKLKLRCRRAVSVTEDELARLERQFDGEGRTKAIWDAKLAETCQTMAMELDEKVEKARAARGVRGALALLRQLRSQLDADRDAGKERASASFRWPPAAWPTEDQFEDIRKRIASISSPGLLNRKAALFHGAVAAALLAVGAGMLVSGFSAETIERWLAMAGAAAGAALIPLVWAALSRWHGHRAARRILRRLAAMAKDMEEKALSRAKDLVKQFTETYRKLYSIRARRHLHRIVERQHTRYVNIQDALTARMEDKSEEASACLQFQPFVANWCHPCFDRALHTATCQATYQGLPGDGQIPVEWPRANAVREEASVDLKLAEREDDLVKLASAAALKDGLSQMTLQARTGHFAAAIPQRLPPSPGHPALPLRGDGGERIGRDSRFFLLSSTSSQNALLGLLGHYGDIGAAGSAYPLPQDEVVVVGRVLKHIGVDDIDWGDG